MHWPQVVPTDRLILRRPVDDDAPAIFDGYAQDREVVRYLAWPPHTSVAETREYLRFCDRGWDAGDELTWALTLRTDGRLIGMIGLRPRGFKHDIGYVLARPYWGRGLAAEAGRAIVDLCARAQRDRVTVRDPGRMSR